MIITQMFDLFVYMIQKTSYNDFVLTFSYFAILVLIIRMMRDLLHVN